MILHAACDKRTYLTPHMAYNVRSPEWLLMLQSVVPDVESDTRLAPKTLFIVSAADRHIERRANKSLAESERWLAESYYYFTVCLLADAITC
jgi:hypothetical protein